MKNVSRTVVYVVIICLLLTMSGPLQLFRDGFFRLSETSAVGATTPLLLAHYKLDEMNGTQLVDASPNKNHGTFNKAAIWREGYIGAGSLVVDDGIQFMVPESASLNRIDATQAMTLSFWVKPQETAVNKSTFYRGDMQINFNDNRGLFIDFKSAGTWNYWGFPYILRFDEWNHVALTVANEKLTVYVDGMDVGSKTFTGPFNGKGFFRGGDCAYCDTASQFDEIRWYDGAISLKQIKAMAAEIKPETTPPSAPQGLTFMGNNDRAANVKWQPATDNIGVKGYRLFINDKPNEFTKYTLGTVKKLEPDTAYKLDVRTVDLAGNLSAPSTPIYFQTDATFDKRKSAVGINLEGVHDWGRAMPFIDVFKTARPWESWTVPAGYVLDKDEFGNIRSLEPGVEVNTMMMQGQEGYYKKGKYILTYEGEGDLRFWAYDGSKVLSSEPGKMVLDVQGDGIWLTLKSVNPDNYIRNIHIVHEEDWDDFPEKIFSDDFLALWKDYRVIRFMEFMMANVSKVVRWEDRMTPQHFSQNSYAMDQEKISGMAVEYMVELSNQLQSDPWFSMPAFADDDYFRQFATYVRDHLDPKLQVYLEYSNETWNTQFVQHQHLIAKGKELGYTGSDFDIAAKYHAHRAKQMYLIFADVFDDVYSAEETKTRLVNVLGGFTTLGKHYFNMIYNHEDVKDYVDVYAGAAYFGGDYGGPKAEFAKTATKAELFADFKRDPEWIIRMSRETAQATAPHGVDFVAYEGGQHMAPYAYYWQTGKQYREDSLLVSKLIWANQQPEMYDVYKHYMDEWKAAGGKLHVAFLSSSKPSKYGSWGLLEHINQDVNEAPKYRAMTDWLRENPVWWEEVEPTYYESVTNVRVTAKTIHSVLLSWSNPATPAATVIAREAGLPVGYEVYVDGTFALRTTGLTATVSGLKPNQMYRVGVKAVYAGEKKSAQLKVTTKTAADTVAPGVVSGLSVTDVTDNQFALGWQSATDNDQLTSYEILLNRKVIATQAAHAERTRMIDGLKPDSTYTVHVRTVDRSGKKSALSAPVIVTTGADTQAPSKPLHRRVIHNRIGDLLFAWDAATDNKQVVRYDLYNGGVKFATTSDTRFSIKQPLPGGNWVNLTVVAVDAAGNESLPSDAFGVGVKVDTQAPTEPQQVGVNQVGSTRIGLRWGESVDNVGVANYEVYVNNVWKGTVAKPAYPVEGLAPETSYAIQIRAVDVKGNKSAFSRTLHVMTLGNGTVAPPVVGGSLAVFDAGRDEVNVSFTLPAQSVVGLTLLDGAGELAKTVFTNQSMSSGSKSQVFSVAGLEEGMYRVRLSAGDAVLEQDIVIDRTRPTISNVSQPVNLRDLVNYRVNNLDVTLSEPGVLSVAIVNEKGAIVEKLADRMKVQAGSMSFAWEGMNKKRVFWPDGPYAYRIDFVDRNGLKAESVVRSFRLDRVTPSVTGISSNKALLKLIGTNTVTFKYTLTEDAELTLRFYDASNRNKLSISLGQKKKGKYSFVWDGRDLAGKYMVDQRYTYKFEVKDAVGVKNLVHGGPIRVKLDFK